MPAYAKGSKGCACRQQRTKPVSIKKAYTPIKTLNRTSAGFQHGMKN
jgi:hypothetical protein